MKPSAYRLVDFSNAEAERARLEEQTRALLDIERPLYRAHGVFDARTLLDVGSGTGAPARWLVEAGLNVTCVDPVPEALRHAPPTRVVASADRLPFPDLSFDVSFARLALQHVMDPGRAVRELARVGRRVVLVDTDADTFLTHPTLHEVAEARRRWCERAEKLGADPRIGRSLRRHLIDAGLHDVVVDVVYVTSDRIGREVFARLLLEAPMHRFFGEEKERLARGEEELGRWLEDPRSFAAAALFVGSGRSE